MFFFDEQPINWNSQLLNFIVAFLMEKEERREMATRCRFSGCCRQKWWWWWWWWCRHRKRKQHQKRQLLLFLLLLLLLLRHSIVDGLRGCRKKQATATAAAKGQAKSKPNANAQGKRHLHSGWMDAEVNGDRGERTALSQTHTAWQTHTQTQTHKQWITWHFVGRGYRWECKADWLLNGSSSHQSR